MDAHGVVKLSRFRTDLARAVARRGQALLDSNNLEQEVAALEPLETYFIVKELGVDAAMPILRHASHVQLQTCIDLDCWDGDSPCIDDLDAWLAPFAAAGQTALATAFLTLDEELQILFLQQSLRIIDTREEEVQATDDTLPRMTTPDTYFVLEPFDEREREVNPFVLVDALYRADLNDAFRLLMASLWELASPLEEQAGQFRAGRLRDLGFVPPDEAVNLFAIPTAAPRGLARWRGLPNDEAPTRLPAVYAQPLAQGCLLYRALSAITEPEQLSILEQELVWLINAAVIAYGEAPRDITHVSQIAERVRDTISLGIETLLTAGDPAWQRSDDADTTSRALQIVERWPMGDLFRHGHARVRALAEACRKQARDAVIQHWLEQSSIEQSDDPQARLTRHFVEALLAPRPLLGGFDAGHPAAVKAFASLEELRQAEQRLHDILADLQRRAGAAR